MDYMDRYNLWLSKENLEPEILKELNFIKGNNEEIKERFYDQLKFGTAGLRGMLGAGSLRLNRYTVEKATQGIADYINNFTDDGAKRGVAIAYDNRYYSPEFAKWASMVLAANGIKTYVFDTLTATPILSFAVRELNAISGFMITASHNPPDYNGFKVYWEDGCQVLKKRADDMIKSVEAVEMFTAKSMDYYEGVNKELICTAGDDIYEKYYKLAKKLIFRQETININSDMPIVYSPLHGTGFVPVVKLLNMAGFKNVYTVMDEPDPEFGGIEYPNPENPDIFTKAVKLAQKIGSEIIMATDPDADRIGVMIRKGNKFIPLNGNQIGILLADYILGAMLESGSLPENGFIVKTIVTSDMVDKIAVEYNVSVDNVLTGFKFIGEKILKKVDCGDYTFILGFEESYGYLAETFVRDKDAVSTCLIIVEMAAWYKQKDMSLMDAMQLLDRKSVV